MLDKIAVMSAHSASINLTNHFLIAMPGMQDPAFANSVVYMCEHSERGALGLVINKPADMSLKRLFEKVDLPLARADLSDAHVFNGGPVQTERGFVLHEAMHATSAEGAEVEPGTDKKNLSIYASTMSMDGGLEMTTSKDVLEALSTGAGPRKVLITLGYSSWAQGQLESEIAENSWLTVSADPAVIFDTPIDQRYKRAMGLLGLEPWMISREAGHA
jgi:putative transcriptional regulator